MDLALILFQCKLSPSRKLIKKEFDPKKDPGNITSFLDTSYFLMNA